MEINDVLVLIVVGVLVSSCICAIFCRYLAKEKGYTLKIGKFPFRALGKSLADGNHDGFVKVIYDDKYGELLGCHIIGYNASNLISEVGIARMLETTYHEILKTIHPHPTLSEAISEATANALDEAIHI